MGASGFTIRFQPLRDAETTPLPELQPHIWNAMADYVWRYTRHHQTVWNGYLNEAGPHDDGRWFTADEDELSMTFWLPDFAGCNGRSAGVGLHWFQTAFAAAYDVVSQLAQDHGWLPDGDKPSLADEVWKKDRPFAWIKLRDDLWQFSFEPDWEDGGLHGDDQFLAFQDLDDHARARVEEAIEGRVCPCVMCELLRPDPGFESNMVESLAHEDPDVRQSAVWYLRQTARPSLDTCLLIAEQPAESARDHAGLCFDFGDKLNEDAAETIFARFQSSDDPMHRSGLLAMAAGISMENEVNVERRLFTFVSALSENGIVREIASEYAGYGNIARGREDHFARALLQHLGASVDYDNNVALTLFNFYMRANPVPEFAQDAIRKLAEHPEEQVRNFAVFAKQQLCD